MLGVTLVQVAFAVGAVYFGAKAAMGFGRDVRGDLFHRVTDFSAREVDHFGAPSLITRITNDVQQVQMLVRDDLHAAGRRADHDRRRRHHGPARGRRPVVAARSSASRLLVAERRARRVGGWSRSSALMQERIDGVNRVLREQITGIRVVRAFVREPDEAERFGGVNDDLTETSLRAGRLMAFMFPIVMLFVLNVSSVGGHLVRRRPHRRRRHADRLARSPSSATSPRSSWR